MCAVSEQLLIEKPYPALRFHQYIFRETVYGIVRRLRFLVNQIEAERRLRQLGRTETRILDVGCGTGAHVTIPLATAGYTVVGLDTDRASIERARHLAGDIPDLKISCATVVEAQLAESFHVVICSEVLEHLAEPELLVRQLGNVLVEDGLLLVTIPNGYGYFEGERYFESLLPRLNRATDKLQHRLVRKWGHQELKSRHAAEWRPEYYQLAWSSLAPDQRHYQRFTAGRIRRLLAGQGFEIVEFRNRTFLAGNILNNLFRDWDSFLAWNGEVTDHLPAWLCSGWMIAARRIGAAGADVSIGLRQLERA